MPIHDLGYRPWTGTPAPALSRWTVITTTGIGLAWQSVMVRRLMIMAFLPALYFGAIFFLYEMMVQNHAALTQGIDSAEPWMEKLVDEAIGAPAGRLGVDRDLLAGVRRDPASVRGEVWSLLIFQLLRTPQAMLLLLLVGLVGPHLISQDVRTRAFLLYFSRPISLFEYLLGKTAVLGFFVAVAVAGPALVLYVLAVALSPDLSVIRQTWLLPCRIVAACAVTALPASWIALALSSLTTEGRYAAFAWFCLVIMGWVADGILSAALPGGPWHLLSLFHCLQDLNAWLFGLNLRPEGAGPTLLVVAIATALSLAVLIRRISAPIRV